MAPKRRLVLERSSDNEKRRLLEPVPSAAFLAELAGELRYEGSAKHKEHPCAFGLEPVSREEDDTLCDGHAGFVPGDMINVLPSLRQGVSAGLIGHNLLYDTTPTILWTVWETGWVFEARITNAAQFLYHGYPLLLGDAFARQVIARYAAWVYCHPNPAPFLQSLREAQERYR